MAIDEKRLAEIREAVTSGISLEHHEQWELLAMLDEARDEVPLVHGRIYGDGPPPRCPVPGCDVHHRDGARACVSIAPTVRARALRERERSR